MAYIIHSNDRYVFDVAVKCENDRYIRLYDESGAEIASFNDISDFSEYPIYGGEFTTPDSCKMPIPLSYYMIGGVTITPDDWEYWGGGEYYYKLSNPLISGNPTTCNVLLNFANGTMFEYTATQEDGSILIFPQSVPTVDIVINSIQITRA